MSIYRRLFIVFALLSCFQQASAQHEYLQNALAKFGAMHNFQKKSEVAGSGDLYFPINDFERKKLSGNYIFVQYRHEGMEAVPENGEIMKHYLDAAKENSGSGIYRTAAHATYKAVVEDGDLRFLIEVYEGGSAYSLVIMKAGTVEVKETERIRETLESKGRVSLYFNFETGESGLSTRSEQDLKEVVKLLQENPRMRMKVEGHTDNVGSEEANQKLSELRATAIKNYLIEQGIAAERIIAEGFGSSKPIASNETEEGRIKNRRVDLVKLD